MISPIQLQPGMDQATMANAINDAFRQIEAENRTKVVRDETGTNRVIMGRYPDGTYGLKVSKPGKDVNTAGPNDLFFNSSQNTFKIAKIVDITVTNSFPAVTGPVTNGGDNGVNNPVAHGLGFVPLVIWTVINPGGSPSSFTISAGDQISISWGQNYSQQFTWSLSVDATNLTARVFRRHWVASGTNLNASNQTYTVRAYCLQQSAV